MTICPVRSLQPFFQLLHDIFVRRPNWRTDRPGKVGGPTRPPSFRFPTRQPHNASASAWKITDIAIIMALGDLRGFSPKGCPGPRLGPFSNHRAWGYPARFAALHVASRGFESSRHDPHHRDLSRF